ncbi:MAG: phage shock protein PspA [Deltaproteobacteria bacterium]|jgi:phage shock protein A|nr:phage shock protein PspA [Deltaproteobacteria bacterium]
MGIFTRFRDIVSSNINAMLDRAEDPEKLIKLMIREMEDTLIELKASCAGVIASRKKNQRRLDSVVSRQEQWQARAHLAVSKGRDDLAREALGEKRRFADMVVSLKQELMEHDDMVRKYQEDITLLEDKLHTAREKQGLLVQRHVHARKKRRAQEEIRQVDNFETIARFDHLESRIDRMEAEADLVNFGKKPTIEEAFDNLILDDDIEKELAALKSSRNTPGANPDIP